MKKLKFLLFAIAMLISVFNSLNAQALIVKDFQWYLRTNDGIYPAVDMMAVFTPSGNILHKQIFIIDKDDSLVPEKGIRKVAFITWVPYHGSLWTMIDAEGIVHPDGKCFLVFHTNGAGAETPPNKWSPEQEN